jgi:hypothetical protein
MKLLCTLQYYQNQHVINNMKYTQQQIDGAYDSMLRHYESKLGNERKYTECEKIVMVMQSNPNYIWWYPYELIGDFSVKGEDLFIGYKAPARLYDLEQKGIVEGRELGKYKVWRLL